MSETPSARMIRLSYSNAHSASICEPGELLWYIKEIAKKLPIRRSGRRETACMITARVSWCDRPFAHRSYTL